MGKSLAEEINELPEDERALFFADLSEEDFSALEYDADFWLRPEQKIPDGDWFMTALICGRGWGKGLPLNTLIPTPDGFKKNGDIQDGDYVFDENGQPVLVSKAHTPYIPERMFRISFSDGTQIEADGDHLWTMISETSRKIYYHKRKAEGFEYQAYPPRDWVTNTQYHAHLNRKGFSLETWDSIVKENSQGVGTRVLAKKYGIGRNTIRKYLSQGVPYTRLSETLDTNTLKDRLDSGERYYLPMTEPVNYPEKVLPIDPWVLGMWLVDGNTDTGRWIACHPDDRDWTINEFESRGYSVREDQLKNFKDKIRIMGVEEPWKSLNLHKGKHIPEEYLTSSVQQRIELVKGLMDSDGTVGKEGRHSFTNTNPKIVEGLNKILRSLGVKSSVYRYESFRYGVKGLDSYSVNFYPKDFDLVANPRKLARVRKSTSILSYMPEVISVEEIRPETVRCLTIESPTALYLAGEDYHITHNTRTMSEWIRKKAMEQPGIRIAIAGRTVADVRNTMVLGDSGVLNVHPPEDRPEYKQHTASLHWPNGSQALLLSSESPDQARGPQFGAACGDEFAAWKTTVDASGATLYSNLLAATRLGNNPQILLGTTPKKTKVMKDLMERSKDPEQRIRIIRGSTLDNSSLSESYVKNLLLQYGDSDLARQEIDGVMLEDSEGIVFSEAMIEKARTFGNMPLGLRKIIAVDPSVSKDPKTADECGIMVIGATTEQNILQRKAFVIEDASLRAAPDVWAQRVVDMAEKYGITNVVAEANQGGALIEMVLKAKSKMLKVHLVHATKGKLKRVEPIVVAMQQGRVKLVEEFEKLEEQMLYYDPEMTNESPDRMDAFAWGCTALLVDPPKGLHFGGLSVSSGRGRTLLRPNQTQTARRKILGTMTHR